MTKVKKEKCKIVGCKNVGTGWIRGKVVCRKCFESIKKINFRLVKDGKKIPKTLPKYHELEIFI